MTSMLHGLFRTSKNIQFNLLIDWVNDHYGTSFSSSPLDNSPLDSNAWFSGFVDADGSFQVHTSLITSRSRLGLSFELTQSIITPYGYDNLPMILSWLFLM